MKQKLLIGVLLILTGVLPLGAQTRLSMSVASFEQDPFDTTPQNPLYEKIDGSGARYAIIKVTSNNPNDKLKEYNFNFGNLKSIVEEHDGELWVYVQKNAKMVTISRSGYRTINKHDLETTIEAGKTYVMMLNVARPIVYTQMVQFTVSPADAGAVVTVKGSKADAQEEMFGTTDLTGSTAKALELGTYTYKIIANNYHTSEGRFTLNDRRSTHKEEVTLRPNFAEITFKVDADADIYVNSELKGRRSWKGNLREGDYQVECRQENHRTSTQVVTVTASENRTYQLNPPTPITGTLALTSAPLGADINIDGLGYGKTPMNIDDLMVGEHMVMLSLDKYDSKTQMFEIQENQTTNLHVELDRIKPEKKEKAPRPVKEKAAPTPKTVKNETAQPSVSGYIQPAFQVGTLMGVGGNAGVYISGFNIEAFATMGLGKESVAMYDTSSLTSSDVDISGTMFGLKLGYGIKASPSVRITPQIGFGALNVSGGDVSSSAVCATIGARVEFALSQNFGISLTPEGQFAASKKEVFEQLEDASNKIKGWGTGANLRVGLFLKF